MPREECGSACSESHPSVAWTVERPLCRPTGRLARVQMPRPPRRKTPVSPWPFKEPGSMGGCITQPMRTRIEMPACSLPGSGLGTQAHWSREVTSGQLGGPSRDSEDSPARAPGAFKVQPALLCTHTDSLTHTLGTHTHRHTLSHTQGHTLTLTDTQMHTQPQGARSSPPPRTLSSGAWCPQLSVPAL